MRNVFYFWICIAMWLLSACSSQKKEDRGDIQVLMKDSVDANGLQRMQVSDSKTSFTYKGKEYQSSVVRRPDDSLPVVINEQGDKFVDNSITLRITSGGKSIVDKVFTKESFASLVDAKFMKHSILEGLVYDSFAGMKILIVEDEPDLRETIRISLVKEHFVVETAADYFSALDKVNDYDYDCILLDIMLPGGSGLDLLRELKRLHRSDSVLIISAKDSLDDKVEGLELGADDYLTKPFHLAELNARVKSVIRRRQAKGDVSITMGNLLLYPDKRQVEVGGVPLQLNRKEFDLLYYFIVNPDRVINKMSLAESVWGDNIDQVDSLDFIYSQVKNLRRKLKQAEATVELKAVYGFGYKLSEV